MIKKLTILFFFVTSIFMLSCQKQTVQTSAGTSRTIKFILYTNKDFSTNNDSINFSIHIKNPASTIAFDSTVTAMKVKDIPGPANKLVFQKTVPNDGSILTAGFIYSIKNVGSSWYLDTCGVNEKIKTIEYPFQ